MINRMEKLRVSVTAAEDVAQGIRRFDLQSCGTVTLPTFTPGSHIDVYCRDKIVRQYSLLNLPSEQTRYQIAVKRETPSRGGSSYMHDSVSVGDTLTISNPRNNFPLDETAAYSVFVAGGIGITPLLSMIAKLR